MRPYQKMALRLALMGALSLWSVGTYVTPARAAEDRKAPPASVAAAAPAAVENLTRSGFEHYYNANYEEAVRDFNSVALARPEDPRALNHLLAAVLFRELYRAGALNSSLYSGDSFLNQKRRVEINPAAREQIRDLAEKSIRLCEQRLAKAPNDWQALYARGVARGLQATYLGIAEKAWFAALRNAIGARRDHERVLELNPSYTDAKTVVGIHNYVAGSLPWGVKAAISVVGLSGSRTKGLDYLREAAAANGETSVDAKVALGLFLRREQRYPEAIAVVRSLTSVYSHNFLLALEEAKLLKDAGKNQEALDTYRRLLAEAQRGSFHEPRLEFAHFDLAEILRGRNEYLQAAENYASAARTANASPELRQKAALGAGEMYDLLERRELALPEYQAAVNLDATSPLADTARRYMKQPYRQ
jgi:tetratricopeptide (TPR) repeat protein